MKKILAVLVMMVVFITYVKANDDDTTTITNSFTFRTNLSVGSSGVNVVMLRRVLSVPLTADESPDHFGEETKEAVRRFQMSVDVPATGFVGPLTRHYINSMDNNPLLNVERLHITKPFEIGSDTNNVRITVEGSPRVPYTIEVSDNVRDWKKIFTFENSETGIQVLSFGIDELFPNGDSGFFRIAMPN